MTFPLSPLMIMFKVKFLRKNTCFPISKNYSRQPCGQVSDQSFDTFPIYLMHCPWKRSCFDSLQGNSLSLYQKAIFHCQCHSGLSQSDLPRDSQLILLTPKVTYNYSPVIGIYLPYFSLSCAALVALLLWVPLFYW